MPVTNTQDVWNRRRIDSTHINPSIMEGERGHTSMFGKGSAVSIIRYAPTFLVQPSITGSFKIPSVLTCNPGVIDASPQANLFFQWKANGVDIPGETNRTITTILDFDSFELTCEVTAVNFLGVAVGISNGITAELIEPIINQQYLHFAITGLNQKGQQNLFKSDVLVTTGISMSQRIDMQQHVIIIPTGMWVELRDDVMSHTVSAISGLGPTNGGDIYDHEVYTIWQPTMMPDLPLINGSAESGDMTGWTVTAGSIVATNVSQTGTTVPNSVNGPWYFSAHDGGAVNASMNQVVDFDPGDIAEIDAGGIVMAQVMLMQDNFTNNYGHQAQVVMDFLDVSDAVLGSKSESYINIQGRTWSPIMTDLDYVPVGTRKARVTINLTASSAQTRHVYVDDIRVIVAKDL